MAIGRIGLEWVYHHITLLQSWKNLLFISQERVYSYDINSWVYSLWGKFDLLISSVSNVVLNTNLSSVIYIC